jgi:hypothetical protein
MLPTAEVLAPVAPAAPRYPSYAAGVADALRFFAASRLARALVLSQVLALAWWLAAAWLRTLDVIPVWYDQSVTFTQLLFHIRDPYQIPIFIQPPWAALVMAPFGLLPLPLSVLVQLGLHFGLLTCLIFKFGGDTRSVLIALTSFMAFDNGIELSMDWVICLGLLLPAVWSGPLLLLKPQLALGAWFALRGRTLTRTVLVALATILVSFVFWPRWPLQMALSLQVNMARQVVSIAPLALMPPALSLAIGLALAVFAHRRRDSAWGLLAWLFFVPYLTLYNLLLLFSVLAARNRRLALLLSAVLWCVYGGVLLVLSITR